MPTAIRVALSMLLLVVGIDACAASGAECPPVPAPPTPEMVEAARLNARDHGFLWRISKDGHASFLYGTMHVGKLAWAFPGPHVAQALNESDTVALELDIEDPGIRERLASGMAEMRSTPLPDSLVKRIRHEASSLCVPYDAIARLAPEMQIDMLTLMLGRQEGVDASYAADAVLARLAHEARKDVVSLETPESQLGLMQMEDGNQTVEFVEDALDELESGRSRRLLAHIVRAWADSDYEDMMHFDEWCECLKSRVERAAMKRLLDERNVKLAARIDALHQSGKRVFAAVGSLHMFGPVGLPTLMKERGYRVERIELNPGDMQESRAVPNPK